jgi:hypothetical protein
MDWDLMVKMDNQDRLEEYLLSLPKDILKTSRNPFGCSLLNYVCSRLKDNTRSLILLLKNGCDPNNEDAAGRSPLREAVLFKPPYILQLMLSIGCNIIESPQKRSILEFALTTSSFSHARILIANGLRLSSVRPTFQNYISPRHIKFEKSVLRCRSAVIAMMRVKRAGNLWRWDKFLLKQMALEIWATRYNEWKF